MPFARNIWIHKISIDEADKDHSQLLINILNFKKKVKPRKDSEKGQKKINILENLNELFERREKNLDAFKTGIFPLAQIKDAGRRSCLARVAKFSDCKQLKILTPKRMPQRSPIVLHK